MNQTDKLQAVMIKQAGPGALFGKGLRFLQGVAKGGWDELAGGAKALGAGGRAAKQNWQVGRGINRYTTAARRGQYDEAASTANTLANKLGLKHYELSPGTVRQYSSGQNLKNVQDVARATTQEAKDQLLKHRYGATALAGAGAYGGLQGAGYLGGALTADRSGQRQVDYLSSMPRLGMLFNPQGTVQNMSRDMASTRPQGSVLNFLPFMGGWRAGNRKVMEKGDQQLIKMLNGGQNLPFLLRLMYALNPEGTVNKMVQSRAGQ